MATLRQMVSRVRSLDKMLNADNTVTDRVIAAELKSKATFYIRRETDKRKLWNTSTIFTNVPCVEMTKVPTADCCDYVSDQFVARSRYKLPKICDGLYGLLIHGVFSVDNSRKLKEITLSRYINLLKLGLPTNDIYYWVYDKFLYISSPKVEVASIWAYFEEDISPKLLYPDCPCPNQDKPNPCINLLDLEFKCPGYLEDVVVKDVLQTLLQTYYRVPNDQTSDNKDDQTNKI
jgi:hypothetical protein